MTLNRSNVLRIRQILLAALVVMVLGTVVRAYPIPASVPYRWQFDYENGPLRLWVDQETGEAFWFTSYKVTNRTGRDRIWAPKFTLFTDAGEIVESGKDVPTRVTNEIYNLLGNSFLETQNEIIGDLLQGEENAREGLVIWPARNLNVNELTVFVAGISGETTRVRNPMTGEQVILYKTLKRDYLIPGDALARGTDPVELVEESWILR